MLRAQSTPEGIRGIYVALPDGENPAGAFALNLDSQGHELKREPLKPGGGMVRLIDSATRQRTRCGRNGQTRQGDREDRAADLPADCRRTRRTRVRITPTSRTSGIRSKSSSTPTFFASGSTMGRRAEPPTAKPTRTSRVTDLWRST